MTSYGIQYRVKLIAGDGTEWDCGLIRDYYFEREWTKMGVEVRRVVMEHDLTYKEHNQHG